MAMVMRAAICAVAMAAALLLSGCGSINSWLAGTFADKIPAWAGGLPPDAPPRPTDPRYSEYLKSVGGSEAPVHGSVSADAEYQAIH